MGGLLESPVGAIIDGVRGLADDLFTSDEERGKIEVEKEKLALEKYRVDAGLVQGQLEINKEEAKHPSVWVAGWRPGIGWVGVVSLAAYYWPKAILSAIMWVQMTIDAEKLLPYPDIGITELIGLLAPMLGMAWLRSNDKAKGVDTRGIK
jgi:hypothetical protein